MAPLKSRVTEIGLDVLTELGVNETVLTALTALGVTVLGVDASGLDVRLVFFSLLLLVLADNAGGGAGTLKVGFALILNSLELLSLEFIKDAAGLSLKEFGKPDPDADSLLLNREFEQT